MLSERRFRKMFEGHQAIMLLIEPESGRIIEANSAAVKFYGYPRDVLCSMNISEINQLPPDQVAAERQRALNGECDYFVFPHRIHSGEIRTVEVYSSPIEIGEQHLLFSVIHDVTERKQAEEAVRDSEKWYRAIFEQAVDSIVLIDTATGELVNFNDQAHKNLGYSREEFKRKKLADFEAMESVEDTARHAREGSKGGPVTFETRHRTQSGEIRDVLVQSSPVRFRRKTYRLSIWHDITEIKRKEAAELRARELEEINRLSNALLASVSHELRTPLTAIKGLSDSLLLHDVEWDDATRQDFLRMISRESETLTHVVENLEKMARLEAGITKMEKRKTHISSITANLSSRLKEVSSSHRLEVSIESNMPPIVVDQLYIGDVIWNLLENAVAFSDRGSRVILDARQIGDEITVSVTDEGVGISPEHVDKIFDRFYRVESGVAHRRGGIGLGLNICKMIVEEHGGRIWGESKLGQGSTIIFSLPAAKRS
ncbi:MAG: PAS domain S-box protein [Dehalococcoidia bacterium]|nr:PAS domain S-box protein [Dehalococcoidia bacterium]